MYPTTERRSAPRIPVEYPVFFHYLPPNPPETRMLDLSIGGAAIEAPDPFPIGSKTSFVFVTTLQQVIECTARVIWVSPLSESKYRVGVCFTSMNDDARQQIAKATLAHP